MRGRQQDSPDPKGSDSRSLQNKVASLAALLTSGRSYFRERCLSDGVWVQRPEELLKMQTSFPPWLCPALLFSLCSIWIFISPLLALPGASEYLHRGWQRLLEEGESCADCLSEECPTPRGCLAGVVKDTCDCCFECANLEGQICDLDNTNHFYGKCGDNLECQLDMGDLGHGEVPEPQCVCLSGTAICGSDGKTHSQICKFMEVVNAHPEANLTVIHEGPCESAPQILSPPYDIWNVTGQDVIFGCEVFAYPMAFIEWRKDGTDMLLPGDDPHISVQFRGGPQKYEVTGWLQIQEVRTTDEGTYHCFARNKFGETVATASLTVLTPDQLNMTGLSLPKPRHQLFEDDEESEYGDDYY